MGLRSVALTVNEPVASVVDGTAASVGVGWVAVSIFLAEAVYLGVTSYWKKGDADAVDAVWDRVTPPDGHPEKANS